MKRGMHHVVLLLGGLAALAVAGCENKTDAPGGDKPATTAAATAAAASGKTWEDLKAELDTAFKGVNTANAGDVDAAIAKFKAAVGAPHRTEGKKDFWYGKMKAGKGCGEVWTLQGGGFGSSGTDDANCK